MPSIIARIKLTQVLVTVAFAAILVVVAVPAVGTIRDRGHIDQIIQLADELGQASLRFREDTGRGAIEFSPSADGASYTNLRYHELSMPQSTSGWRGPYLSRSLSMNLNPYGGAVYLQNDLSAGPAHGFLLNGIAGEKSKGSGQFVVSMGFRFESPGRSTASSMTVTVQNDAGRTPDESSGLPAVAAPFQSASWTTIRNEVYMGRISGVKQAVVQGVIASSIFILVAVVATPTMDEIVEDGKSLKVLRLYERISGACAKHYKDTNKVASEFSSSSESDRYNQKRYHQLSAEQLYSGWKGPYIHVPLSEADNPFGGSVQLRDNLSTNPALGFELADGSKAHESGQYLVLTKIPEEVADRLDQHLDGERGASEVSGQDWRTLGRVEYTKDDGGTLSLFILKIED